MAKARIFISHSTFDDPTQARDAAASVADQDAAEAAARLAREVRDLLPDALRGAGHAVLLDREGLELGDQWRSVLNLWIGGCDAAVVLLSPKALRSTFVAYEASILSYRHAAKARPFPLIPVFLPPVDIAALEKSALKPANLQELQGRVLSMTTAETIVDAIVKQLDGVGRGTTPIELQVMHLVDLLTPVKEGKLQFVADQLGVDLDDWRLDDDLRRVVALKLIGAGLAGAREALGVIRESLGDGWFSAVSNMIGLIGSSWVDELAVERIPALSKSARAIGSNASKPLTAKMYVIRASNRLPRFAWRVAEVDVVTGDFTEEAVRRRWVSTIREGLRAAVPKTTDDQLDKWLATRQQAGEPVFVALPFDGISDALLNQLKAIPGFSAVTFFLLAGDATPSDQFLAATGAEWLRPDLRREDELRFCRDFTEIHAYHEADA